MFIFNNTHFIESIKWQSSQVQGHLVVNGGCTESNWVTRTAKPDVPVVKWPTQFMNLTHNIQEAHIRLDANLSRVYQFY